MAYKKAGGKLSDFGGLNVAPAGPSDERANQAKSQFVEFNRQGARSGVEPLVVACQRDGLAERSHVFDRGQMQRVECSHRYRERLHGASKDQGG